MTKQRNNILWAILVLLVTSCSSPPVILAECNSSVQIYEVGTVVPGDTVFLALTKTGFGWEYNWSTTLGDFDDPHASSPEFTAPEDEKIVTVSVEVGNDQGCFYTDDIEIKVENPVDVVAEETAVDPTATATIEPTFTPTATVEPSSTPEPSPLPEPTAIPTLTPSATNSPAPTPTPQPPQVDPVITYYEILPGSALTLAWSWQNELSSDQNFAVRFWSKDDPRPEARYSITWTKERSYEFSISGYPPGEYLMNVAVMTGPSVGDHHEVVRSEDVVVYVPPVEPTLPPP